LGLDKGCNGRLEEIASFVIKEDKGRGCSMHGRNKTCIQNLGQKIQKEETTSKT
jgi:hypothetical protein